MLAKLFTLLSRREQRQLALLVPAVVVMATMKAAGVASILPFLQLLADPNGVENSRILGWAYSTFAFTSRQSFLFAVGLTVLVILMLGNGMGALVTWAEARFAAKRNHSLSLRLLESYLRRPYAYFLTQNSAGLSRNLLSEVHAVVTGVLMQVLEISSRLVVVTFVLGVIFLIDPGIALVTGLLFGGLYGGIYWAIRRYVHELGRRRVRANKVRFRYAAEMFAGIKEVKLFGLERVMLKQFAKPSLEVSVVQERVKLMAQLPRFALETVAFGVILLILLYLIRDGQQTTEILPLLGLYAFASYRMIPELQTIFAGVTKLRGHAAALDVLVADLDRTATEGSRTGSLKPPEPLPFRYCIELDGLEFRYPAGEVPVLRGIDLRIERGEWLALVGPTGSGKSTLVDLLLGLLEPTGGSLRVDAVPVGRHNVAAWQRNTSYVPQHIFLVDETVARNIAFGEGGEQIDMERVREAARVAQILDFIEQELPKGFDTVIGERGIRLSGGQRQRLGIARALYRRPRLLVLDEATSALDSATEQAFFQALREHYRDCTVISIAHRLTTTRAFDRIYVIDQGTLADSGSFVELRARNRHFASLGGETP
jgi:ATP-binding cassette, subfamily B, bacterial PglK